MSSVAALGVIGMLGTLLAGCANIRGADTIDPDLQAMQDDVAAAAPEEVPPDEVIGPPDAPGVEFAGARPPSKVGPTEHVVLEEEGATGGNKVVAPPRRTKLPSMMSDLVWGPRDN